MPHATDTKTLKQSIFYFSLGNDAIPENNITKPPPKITIASKPTIKSNPCVFSTKYFSYFQFWLFALSVAVEILESREEYKTCTKDFFLFCFLLHSSPFPLSEVNCQLATADARQINADQRRFISSTVNCQLSTVNCQRSTLLT
ncbi:MAG: hypothetical protein HC894_32460 [Microcoleus sp. SM1_3_4]|nr:hypothetical protein [Microcoleus sp. SM1_3_4]